MIPHRSRRREAPGRRLPAFLALCTALLLLFAWAPAAVAQNLDDVPTPEDLELGSDTADEPRAELRIRQPNDRSDVQTPFTVAGTAPAGARLELWLDDELQRVFRADSNGKFTTPVNREIGDDTRIWIHQVGEGGTRIQSTSVRVNWSGQAEARERSFEDPPPPEERPEDPPAPDEDLTVFSDDADPANLTTAPVPPPVDEVGEEPAQTSRESGEQGERDIPSGGFSDMEGEEADDETVEQSETYVYQQPPVNRGARIALEAAGGYGGGILGGLAGGLFGVALGIAIDNGGGFASLIFGVLGTMAGTAVGLPIGVIWVGNLMDGNGAIWATILGEVVGIVGAIGLSAAVVGNGTVPGLAFLLLPIGGAIAGYELSSDPSARAAEREKAGVQSVRPTIAPTSDGRGVTMGFGFRF